MSMELCKCGKKSVWVYLPGYSSGESPFHCEDCVPRGCSCNHRYVDVNAYHPPLDEPDIPDGVEGIDWKWVDLGKIWCYIDELGREYPCVEYDYEPEGFEEE